MLNFDSCLFDKESLFVAKPQPIYISAVSYAFIGFIWETQKLIEAMKFCSHTKDYERNESYRDDDVKWQSDEKTILQQKHYIDDYKDIVGKQSWRAGMW